ncbi:MAG: flagellar protein FlaG [Propionivibrio sp.]|jgi:flagellar protein FlaG|nr:flagellar protein FlaG [Propionivibrio sp.]
MNFENISTTQMPLRSASGTIVQTDKPSRSQADSPAVVASNTPDRKTPEFSLQDAVKRLSEFVSQSSSEINFSIDEESGINIVKVTDSKTNEVIRQFPSEEVIAIARALDKLQGLFIKDKA